MSKATRILERASELGVMITTAESCTAGLVSAAITDVAGSSRIFDRGFVTYTNDAKTWMLGVSRTTLFRHGAVSEEVAAEMAEGALANSHATLAISISGIAGPGPSEFKPEGRVCFGVTYKGEIHTETVEFTALGRHSVREAARDHALDLILKTLG